MQNLIRIFEKNVTQKIEKQGKEKSDDKKIKNSYIQ